MRNLKIKYLVFRHLYPDRVKVKKNYSYEFEGKSALSAILKEVMDVFPSLYEASPENRRAVLEFVKTVCPEIELGYENMWQRFNK